MVDVRQKNESATTRERAQEGLNAQLDQKLIICRCWASPAADQKRALYLDVKPPHLTLRSGVICRLPPPRNRNGSTEATLLSNITEVSRATQWKPGQSGNLNGRPVGTRQAFSAGFLRDLAEVWSEEGRETMVKTARTSPATFFAVCARLIGPEVKLTIEQSLPGNLSMEDWAMMREIVEAVKQAIPDASSQPPDAVLQHVLAKLRD